MSAQPSPERVSRYSAVTGQQELLLRATLLEGPGARAAWEQVSVHFDPESLEYDSYSLLPLLYDRLQRHGVSDPRMGRLKGIYRRTWYDNTLRFHAAIAILRALHDAGIRTMLLNGAALALRSYGDVGLRPMESVDILVPAKQASVATGVVKGLGWTPLANLTDLTEAEALEAGHAYPFGNVHGQEVDLFWHVFHRHVHPTADGELWGTARPFQLSGVPTSTPSPADQLLHAVVRGTETAWWGVARAPSLRWIVDAMMILRTTRNEMDWDRVVAHAHRQRCVLLVGEALGHLHDLFGAHVPETVLARIRTGRVPLVERIGQSARTRPPRLWGPWIALGVGYLDYCSTLPRDASLLRRLAGVPAFLRRRWGSASLWMLPLLALHRGVRRTRWLMEHRRRADIAQ